MSDLIIKFKGGTGNQLFQAAIALTLAKTYKKSCKYNIDNLENNKYKRKLEILPLLKFFDLDIKTPKPKKNTLFLDQYDIDHPIYFSQYSPLVNLKSDIQIEGYFTNYRLHDSEIISKIKKFFRSLELFQGFKGNDYITIHLRELHGVGNNEINNSIDNLNINYYSQAIEKMSKISSFDKVKNVIVFTDIYKKPENSRLLPKIKNLLQDYGLNYIDGDNNINSLLDLLKVFSLSKCSIISNSTLSWWGAYLSEGEIFSPVMNLWEPNLKIPDHWNQIYSNELMPKTHHKKIIFDTSIMKEEKNFKNYSTQRLKFINFNRVLFKKVNSNLLFISIKKWFKKKGILPENPHSTFI